MTKQNPFSLGGMEFGGVVTPSDSQDETQAQPQLSALEVKSIHPNLGDLNGKPTKAQPDLPVLESISDLTYEKIFARVKSFISLDISKTSTGWVRYRNKTIESGYFTIKSDPEDLLSQRKEFREFIIDLFQGETYEYVFIEDTTGSVNYKTARILQQLNPITDDLMEMGLIPQSPIIREDNGVWKKNLRYISNYKSKIKGENDKIMIRNALQILGFGDGTTDTIKEDIYDAHGLAVGVIVRILMRSEPVKKVRLRTDITKVYKIEQFNDEYDALIKANSMNRTIESLDLTNCIRDLKYNFKMHIQSTEDDTKLYVISIPTNKIGALAIDKKFNLDYEMSYLLVYRKL